MYIDKFCTEQQLGNDDFGGQARIEADADGPCLPYRKSSHRHHREHAEQFADRLAATGMNAMRVPVLHNVGIDAVEDTREALVQQLFSPVPWTRIVQTMAASGVTQLIECGPGKVLCGLTRRIDKSLAAFPIQTPETMQTALAELGNA